MKKNRNIKTKLILLLFLPTLLSCFPKQEKFYYVLNSNINLKEKKLIWGTEQEFNTKRIYSDSRTFSESRLFTGSDKKTISFKIEKGVWYFNLKNNLNLFYNYNSRNGGVIEISGTKCQILFKKELVIREYKLHKITLQPIGISQSHSALYYFDVKKGVVLIKMGSVILLRSDSFERPLTDEEISVL